MFNSFEYFDLTGGVQREVAGMRILEKIGYGKGSSRASLAITIFEWLMIPFLIFGPFVWRGMNGFLTRYSTRMATTEYSPWEPVIFGFMIVVFGLSLYKNYLDSRDPKSDFERNVLDPNETRMVSEGKDIQWMKDFRRDYRRRHYVDILTSSILLAVVIMYYEIWIFLEVVVHRNISVMKGGCGALQFTSIEKIYVNQFLKDLPFSLAELFNIHGTCRPDDEVLAIRVMNSLASSLHWVLIIGIVGFIWGKQIKQWLLER